MRTDIEFDAEDGTTLRGWLTTPDGPPPYPTVVMAHGFSAVKEQTLDALARVLASRGLASVVYDHRNLGASDGTPRQDIDPVAQVRDMRTAITFATTREEVDPARIGIFGSSYSGAHVLVVAATDQRVRCVVSQVPLINGFANITRLNTADGFLQVLDQLDAERRARFDGAAPVTIPVCSNDLSVPAAFPGEHTYNYFHHFTETAPNWRNACTVRSIDYALSYDVTGFMERIAPTPLLMIVASVDTTTPTDLALDAFDRAHEPKKIVIVDGQHYDVYIRKFDETSAAAAEWFTAHL
jgi:hypothetical protein